MDHQIRVAIIGAGGWGYQHARAFAARKDTRVVAFAGRTEERTRRRAEEFSAGYYTDIQEMLDREKPGLVSLCLPAQHTFEATMQVIRAGFPLFVEKPLAYDLQEAKTLIREAQKRDLFFAIDLEQRYSIPCLKAAEAIRNGKMGKPVYAHWRFGHGWDGKMTHPHTNLIEAQCHGINLLESLCGRINSVMAEMTGNGGRDSFSTFVLSLRFTNGAVGSFLATMDANEHNRLSQMIEIGGTDGRILIEDNVRRYSFQPTASDTEEVWQAGFFEDSLRSFNQNLDRYLDDMLPALKEGKEPPVPASEGLRALEIAYAAIESFETGRRVNV